MQGEGSASLWSQHYGRSIRVPILSCMCFCWKTSYLIYITDLLTLNSQPVSLYRMSEGSLSNTCIFLLCKGTAQPYELSITLGTRLRTMSNSVPPTGNTKQCGNVALHGSQTGHLFTLARELKQSNISPHLTSAGVVHVGRLTFCLLLCACPPAKRESVSIVFEIANKF